MKMPTGFIASVAVALCEEAGRAVCGLWACGVDVRWGRTAAFDKAVAGQQRMWMVQALLKQSDARVEHLLAAVEQSVGANILKSPVYSDIYCNYTKALSFSRIFRRQRARWRKDSA